MGDMGILTAGSEISSDIADGPYYLAYFCEVKKGRGV